MYKIMCLHIYGNPDFKRNIIVSLFQDYSSFALQLGAVSRVVYSCMGLLCVYGRGIRRFSVWSTQARVIWQSAAKDS